jgi:hypothetical protein
MEYDKPLSPTKYQILRFPYLGGLLLQVRNMPSRLFKPLGVVCEDILKNLMGLLSCTW